MNHSSSPSSLLPGTTFGGDFRIHSLLGEGGMGAVYVAEQLSTGKLRALKTMHRQLISDAGLRQRFQQEAHIGARIESEHVVDVVAAGVDAATHMPWLAMELLKGETVADAAPRGHLAVPCVAAACLLQLGDALASAHAGGVVHRDLKPENLFLTSSRRTDVPFVLKVLDFGIAKLVSERVTGVTASIGTPMWMAPEQTELGGIITPAADVWAYGLIAFFVFTSRSYWQVEVDGHDVSTAVLLRQIVLDPLPLASQRAAQAGVAHRLPAGFDAWFSRCVARSSSARFASGAEALSALRALLAGASPFATTARIETGIVERRLAETLAAPVAPAPRPHTTLPLPMTSSAPVAHTIAPVALVAPPPASRFSLAAAGVAAVLALVGLFAFGSASSKAEPPRSETVPAAVPSAPASTSIAPITPRENALFTSSPVELKWTDTRSNGSEHEIEVAHGETVDTGHAPAGVSYAMWPWSTANAEPGAYRWRARATDGTWSAWSTFALYPSVLDRVHERKKLRVGIEPTYHAPFVYYDDAKQRLAGFDVDLADEIAKSLGVEVERVTCDWADLFKNVESRDLDVVISSVTVTKDRAKKAGFSTPYLHTGIVVATRSGSEKLVGSGAHKTVGAQRKTTATAAAHHAFPQAELREYDTLDAALAGLARAEVDALVADEAVLRARPEVKYGAYHIDGSPLTDDALAVMLPYGDERARQRINASLEELTARGKLAELKKAYGLR